MADVAKKFQAPAILTSISYAKDGGVRLGFVTNELTPEDKLVLSMFHQKFHQKLLLL